MKNFIALGVLLLLFSESVQAGKADAAKKGAKYIAKEIVKNESYQKARQKVIDAYKKEKNCRNTQGGNNANSTAAVRSC